MCVPPAAPDGAHGRRLMPGVVVCHGSAAIRERLALTAQAVPAPIGTRPMSQVPQQNGQRPIQLTQRELEVLAGMSQGRSNAQIGADLFLSEDTVKTHARRLFRKLEAADRAQAVAIGLRRGLIT